MTTLGNGETSLQPHSDPLRKVAAATGVPYQVLRRNGAETALLQYGELRKNVGEGIEVHYDGIDQADALEIPGLKEAVTSGADSVMVKNVTKGTEFKVQINQTERARLLLGAGGRLPFTKQQAG